MADSQVNGSSPAGFRVGTGVLGGVAAAGPAQAGCWPDLILASCGVVPCCLLGVVLCCLHEVPLCCGLGLLQCCLLGVPPCCGLGGKGSENSKGLVGDWAKAEPCARACCCCAGWGVGSGAGGKACVSWGLGGEKRFGINDVRALLDACRLVVGCSSSRAGQLAVRLKRGEGIPLGLEGVRVVGGLR